MDYNTQASSRDLVVLIQEIYLFVPYEKIKFLCQTNDKFGPFLSLVVSHNMTITWTNIPVVWKASSTIPSSSSEAAKWNTENTFFQPDLMLWACECTICATQRTTMSRMVADLWLVQQKKIHFRTWTLERLERMKNKTSTNLPIFLDYIFKGSEEIFLEAEVG